MVSRTIPAASTASSAPSFDASEPSPELVTDRSLSLLDEVVAALLLPVRREPTDAMAATAAVLAGSSWRSYRAGRARIATQAAVYLTWLAPPASGRCSGVLHLPDGRQAFVWTAARRGPVFADLLAPAGADDGEVHASAKAALEQLTETAGRPVAGVRLCSVSSPTRSMLATPTGTMVRLTDTSPWFEEAR